MVKTCKRIVWQLLNSLGIGGAIQLLINSSLKDDGWFRSYHTKQSVDNNGNPLPWLTYSSIKFLESRLKKDFVIYEYGSGNSTIWLASRVGKVISVEHEKDWFEKNLKRCPSNVKLIFKSLALGSEYENSILEQPEKFDVVIIDGRRRVKCAANALEKLKPDGVIVFDNSEREQYKDAYALLSKASYKKIDFHGLAPGIHLRTCTSIFYRDNNCFDI